MKIRNGFVSNSSSSSFIIDDKGSKDYISFIDIVNVANDSESEIDARGKEDIINYIKSNWIYEDTEEEALEALNKYPIDRLTDNSYLISLSYHDELTSIMRLFEKKNLVEVLYGED